MTDVTIENLTKHYGDTVAVDDISLSIEDGELAVVVGPSGCGKTTTLRMIAGLETPTDGRIHFGDRNVTGDRPQDRNISMVFQDLALFPHLTVEENIAFPVKAKDNIPVDEIEDRVHEIAEMVDCDDLLDKRIPSLSGGQQQRVALARAFVTQPDVFLLDEPFSDLDELLQRQIRTEVMNLQDELGVTMIHITHNQEEAMTMGDKIIILQDGRLKQVGTPDDIFERPKNLFVARFIGSPQINQFEWSTESSDQQSAIKPADATGQDGGIDAPGIDDARQDDLTLCVRPQHFRWGDEIPQGGLYVPVYVSVIERLGTEDVIHCVTQAGEEISAMVKSGTVDEDQEGYLCCSLEDILLFDGQNEDAPLID